eukprot:PhM_4_TR9741/c0_g1_i1/m.99971
MVSPYTTSTQRRHVLVQQAFHQCPDASALSQIWYESLRPSTVVTYITTLNAMCPTTKDSTKLVLERARREASVLTTNRAAAMSPEQMRRLSRGTTVEAQTLKAMWIMAGRHADLAQIHRVTYFPNDVIMLQWATNKSDRYGKRAIIGEMFHFVENLLILIFIVVVY